MADLLLGEIEKGRLNGDAATIKGGPSGVNDLTMADRIMIIEPAGAAPRKWLEMLSEQEVVMPTRAVLFGFDGVLADTENVHIAAWQRTLRAMGWNESDETCARAVAVLDDQAFVTDLFNRRKIEGGDVAGWVRRKRDLTTQLLRDCPRLQPGAPELVQALKETGLTLGVVTTTGRAHIETVLAASGLLDAFDVVIAGDDGDPSRSTPESYHLAASRLGIAPEDTVALDNSARSLTAGDRSGLRVVMVGPTQSGEEGVNGDVIYLADLRDQALVLGSLGV